MNKQQDKGPNQHNKSKINIQRIKNNQLGNKQKVLMDVKDFSFKLMILTPNGN